MRECDFLDHILRHTNPRIPLIQNFDSNKRSQTLLYFLRISDWRNYQFS